MKKSTAAWPSNSGKPTEGGEWKAARASLAAELMKIEMGNQVTFGELAERIGESVARVKSVAWPARKDCAKRGVVFKAVRGRGALERMRDGDIANNGKADLNKGRRHFTRSQDRIRSVNTVALDEDTTQKHRVYEAAIAMSLNGLSPQRRTAIAKKLQNGQVDAGDLRSAFANVRIPEKK